MFYENADVLQLLFFPNKGMFENRSWCSYEFIDYKHSNVDCLNQLLLETWRFGRPYLIGSWSSLSSLLWVIFMPLFRARGHPDKLEKKTHWWVFCHGKKHIQHDIHKEFVLYKTDQSIKCWMWNSRRGKFNFTFCGRRNFQWYVPSHHSPESGTWDRNARCYCPTLEEDRTLSN